jgi:rubredoxin
VVKSVDFKLSQVPYKPAAFREQAFNCVFCGAYSDQGWGKPHMSVSGGQGYGQIEKYWTCRCTHCGLFSFWVDGNLVFPAVELAPAPNSDLPADIITDFEEARSILNKSPRGSAALLRLCVQKLCKHLGESGKNINDDIGELVKKGLSPQIRKALDVVRVVGNNAVHPGQIDLADDTGTAQNFLV